MYIIYYFVHLFVYIHSQHQRRVVVTAYGRALIYLRSGEAGIYAVHRHSRCSRTVTSVFRKLTSSTGEYVCRFSHRFVV
jgi:hypothetical protein